MPAPDNVWANVSTTGAGSPITLTTALDGFRLPPAAAAGLIVSYKLIDGVPGSRKWETGYGVLALANSVWTLTRTLRESSTGALLALAGPTSVIISLGGVDVNTLGAPKRVSATYTATRGDNLMATTAGGGFTVTLPTTPNDLDQVRIKDIARSFGNAAPLAVAVGASPANTLIAGQASPMNLNVSGADITLVYNATTNSWEF